MSGKAKKCFAYIGNWGKDGPGKRFGIDICSYDAERGTFTVLENVAPEIHVGAICIDAERSVLYCVDEAAGLPGLDGVGGGSVVAFRIDRETGALTELSRQPTFAPLACFVEPDPKGEFLAVTCHSDRAAITRSVQDAFGAYHVVVDVSDAVTVLYPLDPDGGIAAACDIRKHVGPVPATPKNKAHPHSAAFDAEGNFLFVCDKGLDRVFAYRLDRARRKLIPCADAGVAAPARSAPRYGRVHPTAPLFCYNHEELAEICCARIDAERGLLPSCSVNILPERYEEKKMQASDLRIHPNGRYLYNIMRGINYISVLELTPETGRMELVQTVHFDATDFCGGGARGCCISPDARFLHICSADDGLLITIPVGEDGHLAPAREGIRLNHPANLAFLG